MVVGPVGETAARPACSVEAVAPVYHRAMSTPSSDHRCLACGRNHTLTPLIQLEYLNQAYWICPQHLPMLIHDPGSLIGRLPGAERLQPAEHKD